MKANSIDKLNESTIQAKTLLLTSQTDRIRSSSPVVIGPPAITSA
jgi:hypothetical protein